MVDYEPWLFQVFDELRRKGVPLGIEDYLLAIKLIREGVSLDSPSAFKQRCRLLWAKSREDQELFDVAFERTVEGLVALTAEPDVVAQANNPPPLQDTAPSTPLATPPSTKESRQESTLKGREDLDPSGVSVSFHPLPLLWQSSTKSSAIDINGPYYLTPHLHVDRREMTELWRQLRRPQRVGPPEELDVEGTLDKVSKSGFFLDPVMQPRRKNQARLVVLLDKQGSMAPFSLVIKVLVEGILLSGLSGRTLVYYYHDCPEDVLFKHPGLTGAIPLQEVLYQRAKDSSVLIVSDAGAARRYYDGERVASTKRFLKVLSTYTYLYTWLNPVPHERWEMTTAEDIASMVPMFPMNREGLNDAINILRGHPFPPGVKLDAE